MSNHYAMMNPVTHRLFVGTPPVPTDKHKAALLKMQAALENLQETLTEADFPPESLYPHSAHYLSNLKRLKISLEPAPMFYDINLVDGLARIGTTMLESLLQFDDDQLTRFTELFLLHENVHVDQGMYSQTWYGVQYASVVLEQMDYFADAFAQATAIARKLRCQPELDFQVVVKNYAIMAVEGDEAFDKMDYPDGMPSIVDARLRRYLIWYTQNVRLHASRSMEEVLATLYPQIAVELAPMIGTLDEYGEKVVTSCPEGVEYFLALDGYLVREPNMPGFDINVLFNAILAYDQETAMQEILYPVMQNRELLLPQL